MRVSVFVLAVLSVFGILAYTIWLESAIIVEAYAVRQLRGENAEMQNRIQIRLADLASRKRPERLEATAKKLGLDDLKRNVAKIVIVPKEKRAARGAD